MEKEIAGEYSFKDESEPSSSNSDHNFEVIDTSNMTLERSEDVSYGRIIKFIYNLCYVFILLLAQLS